MNKLSFAFVVISFASLALKSAQPEINPSHIDAYVTPYYDSKVPAISVGFSRATSDGWSSSVAFPVNL